MSALEMGYHQEQALRIHELNKKWWLDLETGEPKERNLGEIIALIHSELSEALEGLRSKQPDSHLPEISNFRVEIADAAIRTYDLLGYFVQSRGVDLTLYLPSEEQHIQPYWSYYLMLLQQHKLLSDLLEHLRKGEERLIYPVMLAFLLNCFGMIAAAGANLQKVIDAKLVYNATRQDHTLEARREPNGKKF